MMAVLLTWSHSRKYQEISGCSTATILCTWFQQSSISISNRKGLNHHSSSKPSRQLLSAILARKPTVTIKVVDGGPEHGVNYGFFYVRTIVGYQHLGPPRTQGGIRLTPDSRSQENSDQAHIVKRIPPPVLFYLNLAVLPFFASPKSSKRPKT